MRAQGFARPAQPLRVPAECDPLDALDAQGQIKNACAAKLDVLQSEFGIRNLFFNNRTYARSSNAPVEYLLSRADPRKVIAPAELVPAVPINALPTCTSGVVSTNACRATVSDPFDLGGPWAPPLDRQAQLRDFLRALRDRGLLSLAYSSPQFYFYGIDRYLADLRQLRSSAIGFDGVYLDGAPAEGDVVGGVEATRRIREAVGVDGRILFHLTSGRTSTLSPRRRQIPGDSDRSDRNARPSVWHDGGNEATQCTHEPSSDLSSASACSQRAAALSPRRAR